MLSANSLSSYLSAIPENCEARSNSSSTLKSQGRIYLRIPSSNMPLSLLLKGNCPVTGFPKLLLARPCRMDAAAWKQKHAPCHSESVEILATIESRTRGAIRLGVREPIFCEAPFAGCSHLHPERPLDACAVTGGSFQARGMPSWGYAELGEFEKGPRIWPTGLRLSPHDPALFDFHEAKSSDDCTLAPSRTH
jgi:hypothetical protein